MKTGTSAPRMALYNDCITISISIREVGYQYQKQLSQIISTEVLITKSFTGAIMVSNDIVIR